MISAVPKGELLRLEAELCRARCRSRWWDGASNDVGAVGRMIRDFLDARNHAANHVGAAFKSVNQMQLRELLEEKDGIALAGATLSNFFNGEANTGGKRDWFKIAPRLLRYVLQGTIKPQPDHSTVIDRICDFFFPKGFVPGESTADRNHTWYFHPRLRRLDAPATTAEASAELRAIAYYCSVGSPRGKGLIVRTSGKKRFMQVEDNELTESGKVTIECLAAGVTTIFVFPNASRKTEAQESAERFAELAAIKLKHNEAALQRLQLVSVDLCQMREVEGEQLWGGEYLSRTLRYIFHRCDLPAGCDGWSTLTVARGARWGLCGFQTDEDDVRAFEQWCNAFVPYLDRLDQATTQAAEQSGPTLKLTLPSSIPSPAHRTRIRA